MKNVGFKEGFGEIKLEKSYGGNGKDFTAFNLYFFIDQYFMGVDVKRGSILRSKDSDQRVYVIDHPIITGSRIKPGWEPKINPEKLGYPSLIPPPTEYKYCLTVQLDSKNKEDVISSKALEPDAIWVIQKYVPSISIMNNSRYGRL